MKRKNWIMVCFLMTFTTALATDHIISVVGKEFIIRNSFVVLQPESVKLLTWPARSAYKNAEVKIYEHNGVCINNGIELIELYDDELNQFINKLNNKFPGPLSTAPRGIPLDDGAPFADE